MLEKLLSLGRKIIPSPVFNFFQPFYHFLLGLMAALVYGFPYRKLKVIGVTGTNGKSTVVHLASQILEEAGYAVASLSSIEFKIKDRVWKNNLKMTMPGRFKLQRFLRQAVKAGCDYLVLEVTSEGIKQHRQSFIRFNTALLTNLTEEHLESHGGFENYKRAKAKLFHQLRLKGKSIVNLDDPQTNYFLRFPADKKWGYGLDFQSADSVEQTVRASDYQPSQKGINFRIDGRDFKVNLLGKFNLYNVLAAVSVGLAENISLDKIKEILRRVKGIPGRLEVVIREPFTVIVDYAHTPDALKKVYQTIRESFGGLPNGEARRLIGVLGAAGGGRDKWKRPEFGRIAEQYLDEIIVTNEDPYDEDPEEIIDQIVNGIEQRSVRKIIDRRQAINQALKLAQQGDVVIVTGKGCEPWICLEKGKKIPWDDRKIVKEEFKGLSK